MNWGKNSWVPICTKFISTTTRIQRLRPLLSSNDAYIKVKRMVCLLDRSGFEIGRNFCAAQGESRAENKRSPSVCPKLGRKAQRSRASNPVRSSLAIVKTRGSPYHCSQTFGSADIRPQAIVGIFSRSPKTKNDLGQSLYIHSDAAQVSTHPGISTNALAWADRKNFLLATAGRPGVRLPRENCKFGTLSAHGHAPQDRCLADCNSRVPLDRCGFPGACFL